MNEIKEVARQLTEWSHHQADEPCCIAGIIVANLAGLRRDPDDMRLRRQTVKNIEALEKALRFTQ